MNHATAPSAAADRDQDDIVDPYAAELAAPLETRLGKIVYTKRIEFLAHLLAALDAMVYAQLCYIYLLDCGFLRFVVRAAVQWMLLSPITFVVKPPPPPGVRTVVGTIVVAVGCVLWHVWADAPSAGEETEGYLHGGVVIDFVGQKGPTSKVRLVLNDMVVLGLQLVMHAVVLVKQRIPSYAAVTNAELAPQEMESEERGERRRLWNPDGSARGELEEEEEGYGDEQERSRTEMEQRSFQVAAGEFVVAKVDLLEALQRTKTEVA